MRDLVELVSMVGLLVACFGCHSVPPDSGAPAAVVQEQRVDLEQLQVRGQELLEQLHASANFPGGSAALVLADQSVITWTFGTTEQPIDPNGNGPLGRPINKADRFLSGSIGKTYVAAMALNLASSGLLDLDAPAWDYLKGSGLPVERIANLDHVTVRQLLRHESGLARYVFASELWEAISAEPDRVWEPADLLAYIFDAPAQFEAGEGWAYSDTNYILVGMILEQLAGQTMYSYVQEHLTGPLGLVDTVASDSREIEGLVQGHSLVFASLGIEGRVVVDGQFVINPQFEWCGGGFASTPADLALWSRAFYSGSAGGGDYLDELLNSVPANPRVFGPGSEYGPACVVRPTDLGPNLGHDGVMVGYLSSTAWFPDHELALAIQINQDRAVGLGMHLAEVLELLAAIAIEATDD